MGNLSWKNSLAIIAAHLAWEIPKNMQIAFPPEVQAFVQRQLNSGKYSSLMDLILAAVKLLQQQEDIYQGRLLELQQDALVGLESSQNGQVVDGPTAMAQIRTNLRQRYSDSDV